MFLEYHTDINTHRPATSNILFSVFLFFSTNIAYVQLWEHPVEYSTWTLGEDALCPMVCCVGGPTWIKCLLMDPTRPRSEWDQFRAWVKTLYFFVFLEYTWIVFVVWHIASWEEDTVVRDFYVGVFQLRLFTLLKCKGKM